jgi:hypothetical protein
MRHSLEGVAILRASRRQRWSWFLGYVGALAGASVVAAACLLAVGVVDLEDGDLEQLCVLPGLVAGLVLAEQGLRKADARGEGDLARRITGTPLPRP